MESRIQSKGEDGSNNKSFKKSKVGKGSCVKEVCMYGGSKNKDAPTFSVLLSGRHRTHTLTFVFFSFCMTYIRICVYVV